jgi:hypothetical protein
VPENGTSYPLTSLLTSDLKLNETAYEENGPVYAGPQFLWNLFFDYASYTSGIVWALLFGYPRLKQAIVKLRERRRKNGVKGVDISEQYNDQLNLIQRAYPEVPLWWFVAVFFAHFIICVVIISKGLMFIPIWTYFVAIATGAIIVIPLGWLYALSNYQLVRLFPDSNPTGRMSAHYCFTLAHRINERGIVRLDGQRHRRVQKSMRGLDLRVYCWRCVVSRSAHASGIYFHRHLQCLCSTDNGPFGRT